MRISESAFKEWPLLYFRKWKGVSLGRFDFEKNNYFRGIPRTRKPFWYVRSVTRFNLDFYGAITPVKQLHNVNDLISVWNTFLQLGQFILNYFSWQFNRATFKVVGLKSFKPEIVRHIKIIWTLGKWLNTLQTDIDIIQGIAGFFSLYLYKYKIFPMQYTKSHLCPKLRASYR